MAAAGRWRPALGVACGTLAVAWGLARGFNRLDDNSFLTHLATGRLILDRGSVPDTDPYSFTAAGEAWTVQSWLASVIYAGVERLGGLGGLHVLYGALVAALAAAVWALSARASGLLPRLAIPALVIIVSTSAWTERPLLFGLLGLALVVLTVEREWTPWFLVPVLWVWVNTHGSFPLAVAYLVAAGIGRAIDGGGPVRSSPEWRTGLAVVGGLALGAVNPVGPSILTFPVAVLDRSDAFRVIVEWQSPGFTSVADRGFLVLVLVAVAGLVRRPSWRDALPALLFVALALVAVRNTSTAALVLTPVVTRAWGDLGTMRADDRGPVATAVAGLGAALSVALLVLLAQPADFEPDAYPATALALLGPPGERSSTRLATEDFTGNFLTALDGGDAAVFVDDRVDMYPVEHVLDYVALVGGRPGWQAVLDDHEIGAVLWSARRPLAALVTESPDWQVAYRDERWVLACRRQSDACDDLLAAPP